LEKKEEKTRWKIWFIFFLFVYWSAVKIYFYVLSMKTIYAVKIFTK
jgi:hypothetical protein